MTRKDVEKLHKMKFHEHWSIIIALVSDVSCFLKTREKVRYTVQSGAESRSTNREINFFPQLIEFYHPLIDPN